MKLPKWRLIVNEEVSAAWNMAVDEALLRLFRPGDTPILRFYRWNPALSFGRFSKPAESVDLDLMEKRGVACVRRITGGGILIHGGDISYSLVLPSSFAKEHGVKGSYRHLCRFLIRFYEKLGLSAAFAGDSGLPESRSRICLAGREAYDIVIDGEKIGGNAQRHTREAMLQHGSIPLRYDYERFESLFLAPSGLESGTSLKKLEISHAPDVLRSLLTEAFRETMAADLLEGELRHEEASLARRLLETKYTNPEWNLDGKEPTQKA
ncbi:lipoate--protein ligase family protein [Hydrogenimonas sp.]